MTQKFIKAAVIGHPIGHSKSPLIHNSWIKDYGLTGSYEAIDFSCENLKIGIDKLIQDGFSGFNVTVPHKINILHLCNSVDDLANIVGAVNTVVIRDGLLHGTNTDVYGFVQNIKEDAPHFSFTNGPALVIGAGGAARAVVQGLIQEGVPEIRIANRTQANVDLLIKTSSSPDRVKIIHWNEKSQKNYLSDVNLVVNTTSLGMTGKDPLDIDLEHLPVSTLVNDIVYSPLQTGLLLQASKRGNATVTGIGMLLHQARPAFAAWFGVMPDVSEDLKQRVLA